MASGAVADLLQADPALTPDGAKALLMYSANKHVIPQTNVVSDSGQTFTDHNDIFTVGAGYLDVAATIQKMDDTWYFLLHPWERLSWYTCQSLIASLT